MGILSARERRGWILFFAPLVASCGTASGPADTAGRAGAEPPSVEEALAESPQWVDFHDPDRSDGGYNLALYQRRVPFLMDMNGRAVHTWPRVRASGRAKLLPSGHLAVISNRGRLEEYDWEGRPTWSFKPKKGSHMLHHDFTRLRNGNYLVLIHWPGKRADYLLEVDRSGDTVWRWNSHEALRDEAGRATRPDNLTHMNSVQELPPNRWFDQGHEEFRPGNILVSARNLNALYVVARPRGEVVWRYYGGLDWQHEARMAPAGVPGEGNVFVFNNRYHDIESFRQSAIIEIHPVQRSVVWSYQAPGFFSATGGTQQVLSNGNLLVTSSRGGRVFELTREGEIVWQWAPPYWPMRVSRYPYGFCAQLASLGPPSARPVRRRNPERHIDADQYAFALTHGARQVRVDGSTVALLDARSECQRLRLPEDAELSIGYGIEHPERCGEFRGRSVRFAVSIRPSGSEASEDLLERTVEMEAFLPPDPPAPVSLRRETLSLERFGRQVVEICLTMASASGGPPPPCFVWGAPGVRPATRPREQFFEEERSAEVEEHQRRQLEALGYVN